MLGRKDSGASFGGTNSKVLSERLDVVHKTILRAFRKFYSQLFNHLTSFKKIKRRVNYNNNYIDLVRNFARRRFGGDLDRFNIAKELHLNMGALMHPKELRKYRVERGDQLCEEVHCVLYNYNKERM